MQLIVFLFQISEGEGRQAGACQYAERWPVVRTVTVARRIIKGQYFHTVQIKCSIYSNGFIIENLEFLLLDNLSNCLREANPLSDEILEREDVVHKMVNLDEKMIKMRNEAKFEKPLLESPYQGRISWLCSKWKRSRQWEISFEDPEM